MDEILIATLVVALIPLYPGWLMSQKAFFISRNRVLMVLLCCLLPAVMAAPFFYLPFWLAKGQERDMATMVGDLVIWGICPVALLGFVAYVMDYLDERPLRSAIAGASCFAISCIAVAYYLFAAQLQADLDITITPRP